LILPEPQTIPGTAPVYEDFARCVHCGLCLNHCPTYRMWQLEADSPRGRIQQMIRVELQGEAVSSNFVEHIDKCLDCRACETACPSGVEYGKLVEHARARIERDYRRPFFSRLVRDFVFNRLIPFPERLAAVGRILKFYQRSGMQAVARGSGFLRLLGLGEKESLLPEIDDTFFYEQFGKTFAALGTRRARVAIFAGCVANVTFTKLNKATIRVLTANGCEVVVPTGQNCCGALAAHAGMRAAARGLARQNVLAFRPEEFDAIVTNSAGCGSTLKEYCRLFSFEEKEFAAAQAFQGKVRDVTEFLSQLGLTASFAAIPARVTYQDSCHLLHGQKVRSAPRELLRAIPGIEFVELPYSEICCGSAGSYNMTETQASLELLAEKMKWAESTRAEIIATANPGCLLQLRAGVKRYKSSREVLHVVELLDRAMQLTPMEKS
jgi:glycolate oxidase iron-sulfur subunit